MKILFVPSDNNYTSGAFRSMAKLNQILNTNFNIETLVVLPDKSGDGESLLESYGISYQYIESHNWIIRNEPISKKAIQKWKQQQKENKKAINEFVNLIKKYKPDIVHINTSYSYVAAEAAYSCNVPVVWHLREFLEEDQTRRFIDRRYANKLLYQADRVITISKALYKKYEKTIPNNKLRVIYNGIDTNTFYKKDKKIFQQNKVIFACVGAVNENKGHLILMEAIGRVRQKGLTNFEIWLIGNCSPHMEKEVRGKAKAYGFSPNLKILGRRDDVDQLIERADVVFMCSKFEAFGRVTVEAMLTGCLLIGANSGGTKEIVKDKRTGLLYDSLSPDALADTISYALSNKKEMRAIANRGREYMFKNMSAETNAKNIVDLYKEVLAKKKVTAVVVTYNRKEMLLQCIAALEKQTYRDFDILIVDNASTDGTEDAVRNLSFDNISYINTGKNIGGAGGFHIGVKEAFINNAKWIWIMDDDVIPNEKALEELMKATEAVKGKASFFASCVKSMDGQAMNTPGVDMRSKNGYPYWYEYLNKGLVKLNAATFVSVMFNHNAVANCGYPCKDFFIWGDDSEYTKRVYRNYGNAYLVGRSNVIHMREGSAALDIFTEDNPARINFYYYMVRNTLTYTKAYADEKAFREKVNSFNSNIRRLKFSKDPNKKQKIKVIKKGMKDYFQKKYDYDAFAHRLDILYGVPIPCENKAISGKKELSLKQKMKKVVFYFPRKVKGFFKCLKENGMRYTLNRLVYGKNDNPIRIKIGKILNLR